MCLEVSYVGLHLSGKDLSFVVSMVGGCAFKWNKQGVSRMFGCCCLPTLTPSTQVLSIVEWLAALCPGAPSCLRYLLALPFSCAVIPSAAGVPAGTLHTTNIVLNYYMTMSIPNKSTFTKYDRYISY